jgi:hypothetical protein
VVRIHNLDPAIVEIAYVPRCQICAVNPCNAGDDGVRDRDRSARAFACSDEITVAISRPGVERQQSLLGLTEHGPFSRLPIRADTALVWFTTSRQQTQTGPTTFSGNDLAEVAKALSQFGNHRWTNLRLGAASRSILTATPPDSDRRSR